jgi:hypothetical protein
MKEIVNGAPNIVTLNSVAYILNTRIVKPAETAIAGEQHFNNT